VAEQTRDGLVRGALEGAQDIPVVSIETETSDIGNGGKQEDGDEEEAVSNCDRRGNGI
jgi:hypothetical protein